MLEVFFLAQFDCPYFLNKNSKIILDVILGQKMYPVTSHHIILGSMCTTLH